MGKQTHEYSSATYYCSSAERSMNDMAEKGWRIIDTTSWPSSYDPAYRNIYVLWERPIENGQSR